MNLLSNISKLFTNLGSSIVLRIRLFYLKNDRKELIAKEEGLDERIALLKKEKERLEQAIKEGMDNE